MSDIGHVHKTGQWAPYPEKNCGACSGSSDLTALEAQFHMKAVWLASNILANYVPSPDSIEDIECRAVLALHAEIEKRKGGG